MKASHATSRRLFRVRFRASLHEVAEVFRGFEGEAAKALLATLLLLGPWAARLEPSPTAQKEAPKLVLLPGSRLWLEGNSTLHPYSSTASKMDLTSEIESAENVSGASEEELLDVVRKGGVKNLGLTIAVSGLKSGKGGLDKNMYKALKAKEHPVIRFELLSYELQNSSAQNSLSIKVRGKLSVAGQGKAIDLEGEASSAKGGLWIRGSKELLMTDFGIRPPTMFLGTLKTENKVVVRYEIFLGVE